MMYMYLLCEEGNCAAKKLAPIKAHSQGEITKNKTLVTCTHSNINILHSLCSVCYYL